MSSCNRYTHDYRDLVTIKGTAAVVLTNRYMVCRDRWALLSWQSQQTKGTAVFVQSDTMEALA